jgi:hypothetical protein
MGSDGSMEEIRESYFVKKKGNWGTKHIKRTWGQQTELRRVLQR